MIKSMTGFGRCEVTEQEHKFTVEVKSVNHRYLDVNIRLPRKLGFLENAVRTVLKAYIQRGKVDVYISHEAYAEEKFALKYNAEIAQAYLNHLRHMAEAFGLENDVSAVSLSRYPEVFTMEEQEMDEQELWGVLERALRGACESFVESRIAEGASLAADLAGKLDALRGYVDYMEARAPEILSEYRKRLEEKVMELFSDRQVDESRIAMEVTLFADKICVDEETVRLRSHVDAMTAALREGGSIGRKLDFIAQEMNREANTILSKTTDLSISNVGINLKTDIEKIREQIQNIE